ncbi:MAG TPA: 2OG-Fe(II) oxygenase [Myxococcales bacterium]|jgi:PKHD-type hydroxylase|nr:2OG-Fe(II) oxygenase [Myxococcales bacterium]
MSPFRPFGDQAGAPPAPNPHYSAYVCYPAAFSGVECDRITSLFAPAGMGPGTVGTEGTGESRLRRSRVGWLSWRPEVDWIFAKLLDFARLANDTIYHFDISGLDDDLQLTEYQPGDYYDWHQDAGPGPYTTRKLSLSLVLTDAREHQGGRLRFPDGVIPATGSDALALAHPVKGTLILFPSYQLHRVDPVTSGTRRSLVAWLSGPPFR